jgi:pilus biogenesis lipoprotein CpaD
MQKNSAGRVLSISRFASEYLRRGRGPFLVSQAQGAAAIARSQSRIVDFLSRSGVPKHLVFFQTRPRTAQGRDTVELSYKGYVVKLPSCGDWSGHTGFNPSNRSHTDFGCSFQRNTGLMLSDPGDLSIAGGPVERDTPSSDRVIKTYRNGKSLGTPKPALEQKDFADVK